VYVCSFSPDGTLNNDFGTDGIFYYSWYSNNDTREIIFQNGSKYVFGTRNTMISLNQNGGLDTIFNNTGVFICENFCFQDLKSQRASKIILGGSSNNNFAIARLNIPSDVSVKPYPYIDNSITIFPNPAKDYLYFDSEKQFEVFDIQGRMLLKSEKAMQSVNVSHLKAGIYFIRFENGQVKKFVKE